MDFLRILLRDSFRGMTCNVQTAPRMRDIRATHVSKRWPVSLNLFRGYTTLPAGRSHSTPSAPQSVSLEATMSSCLNPHYAAVRSPLAGVFPRMIASNFAFR